MLPEGEQRERGVRVDVKLALSDIYQPYKLSGQNLALWAIALACCGLPLYLSFSARHHPYPYSGPIQTAAWIFTALLVAALLVGPDLTTRARAKKARRFQETVRYAISAEGVLIQSELVRAEFKWAAYSRIEETPTLFILRFRSSNSASYIPKRCLDEPKDIPRLRSLVAENFKGEQRLLVQEH